FREFAKSVHFDIRVFYYAARARDRLWEEDQLAPYEFIMPGATMLALGTSAHVNPGVITTLAHTPADIVVVSDYSAPTAQFAMRYLNRVGKPWVFWGEIPGLEERGPIGRWVRGQLQRPIHSGAAAIAAIGCKAAETYRALIPGLPVFNIPYFCDL